MSPNINHVLKIYLGTDEKGAYEPLYGDDRLREAFPERYSEMKRRVTPYLEMEHEPDGRLHLMEEAEKFAEKLRPDSPSSMRSPSER